MGKLVVTEFVSVDGVFEDPGGSEDFEHGGWTFEYDRGDDGNQFKLDELMDSTSSCSGASPTRASRLPGRRARGRSRRSSTTTRSTSSRTRSPIRSGRTRRSSRATSSARLEKLKDETEGTILVAGSGTLVNTLLEHDLVDQLRLMVFPTILGRGRRLFPDGIDRLKFSLVETRTVGPDGVQVQVYDRAR